MKNILPAPPIEITRTIKEKIFIISWTWFLLIFVYQNIFYGFVEELNNSGKINFGSEFHSYQIIWGEHILPNILKLLIDVVIAVLGGATVGYLLTRARITFKFFYSFFSAIVQHFLYLFITLFVITLMAKGNISANAEQAVFYLLESLRLQPLYGFFLLLSVVSSFGGYYYGINLGIKLKEENFFNTDTNSRSTFLDVKWYHWLWFWMPVSIYLQTILRLIYATSVAVITALKHWKWYNLFGVSTSTTGNEPQPDSIGGILFSGYLMLAIVFYILYLIWEILSGRKSFKNKYLSFFVVFLLSFVLPLVFVLLSYWLYHRK